MSERLDVVGIGNAMVDAIIPSSRAEVEKHQINRDSMNLINEELKNKLHKDYSIKEMIGGYLDRDLFHKLNVYTAQNHIVMYVVWL